VFLRMTFNPEKLTEDERMKLKDNIADLQKKFALFNRIDDLSVGDIVAWKPGLRNRRYPRNGTAGIVTRVFPVPIKNDSNGEAGSPYFNEELTVGVGVIDVDGDFIEFAYDGRRLERVEPNSIEPKHFDFACDGCGAEAFTGLRFHCTECDNFDLCPHCHSEGAEPGSHSRNHKMIAVEPCSEDLLRERFKSFCDVQCFQPGNLVQWKPGLKNKRLPEMNELAVVVEVLPVPISDQEKASSGSYFLEPLDIKLGMHDEDGDFVVYHYDSRRFTKAM